MPHLNSVNILTSAALIGGILNLSKPFEIGKFLANKKFFEENKDFFVYQVYKRFDVADEEYRSKEPEEFCARMKNHVRLQVQQLINQEIAGEEKRKKKEEKENREQRMQSLSAQHKEGTTAELMALLGVSKSEVRRLRASGELDAAIAKAKESRK